MRTWVRYSVVALAVIGLIGGSRVSAPQAQEAARPAATEQQQPSLLERAVNDVRVSSWSAYGPGQTARILPAQVQGNNAFRVDVATAGTNPWDVGANALTNKPIAVGDVLLLGVWARAERLPQGAPVARINIGLQLNEAPYTPMATRSIEVGPEWKLYFLQADAPRAYNAGQAGASVHLATASQTIDLGPVFILDFGPGFDKSRLPTD
jgi:hypothetical protein